MNPNSIRIPGWDTGAVISLLLTFYCASAFNQDISWWGTSAVTTLRYTFYYTRALSFQLPIQSQHRRVEQNRNNERERKEGYLGHSENPKRFMFASLLKKFKRIRHQETLENCITTVTTQTHDYKIYHHFVTGNKWQCSNF